MHNRREFLTAAAAAALPARQEQWRNRQPGISYRRLGRTGYMVSEIVMGGNPISPDNWEHVLLALDMGLNYLDTARIYGRGASEAGYARVIAARKRDSFFLNSKVSFWDITRGQLYKDIFDSLADSEQKKLRAAVQEEIERSGVFQPDYVCDYFAGQRGEVESAVLANLMAARYGHKIDRDKNYRQLILESVDQSLKTLGTDHLDLLMCPHGASTPWELLNHPEIFEAFETLKKQGKVGHLGVSAHNDPGGILNAAVDAKVYSVAMVAYSIVNHRFVDPALERAYKNDLGVIAMKAARPVFPGRKTPVPVDPKRLKLIEDAVPGPLKIPQKAYIWVLRNPHVSAANSEMMTAGHVRDNVPLARLKKA
ncbi:MAG: aldo/keto reductase [Acidobacteria bacterium]|nr:aldo/keto reductase [Acidobacteriota bacterium]